MESEKDMWKYLFLSWLDSFVYDRNIFDLNRKS